MITHRAIWRQDAPDTAREAGESCADKAWLSLVGRAAMHEFYTTRQIDAAGAGGCALAFTCSLTQGRPLLWVRHDAMDREVGTLHASGISDLGLDPAGMILLRARNTQSALQAALEGARCSSLGAVIVEFWGEASAYDLTASRRLSLAAKASGVPVFLLRSAARPAPSTADTRWQVHAAPSGLRAARAPGDPRFALTLLRARNGQEGLSLYLEWSRDARAFRICEANAATGFGAPPRRTAPASLPRRLVSVSFDRSGTPSALLRQRIG